MNVGIIGTGPMGLAMACGLRRAGVPVRLRGTGRRTAGGRPEIDDVVSWARVLVLAVPFPVALTMVSGSLSRHGAGRTLLDVTNPAMTAGATVVPGRSGGELIAGVAGGWRVAKAFNTVSAALLAQPPPHPQPVSLPVASDHETAMHDTFHLARSLGLHPLNAGGIASSRHLESLAVLLREISARHHGTGRITITVDTAAPTRRATTRLGLRIDSYPKEVQR